MKCCALWKLYYANYLKNWSCWRFMMWIPNYFIYFRISLFSPGWLVAGFAAFITKFQQNEKTIFSSYCNIFKKENGKRIRHVRICFKKKLTIEKRSNFFGFISFQSSNSIKFEQYIYLNFFFIQYALRWVTIYETSLINCNGFICF